MILPAGGRDSLTFSFELRSSVCSLEHLSFLSLLARFLRDSPPLFFARVAEVVAFAHTCSPFFFLAETLTKIRGFYYDLLHP